MPATVEAAPSAKPRSVAAIIALVLGIIALISSWVPIINNLAFLFALVGAAFAIVALVGTLRGKKSGKGLAVASAAVNVIALAIVLATQSAYSSAIEEAAKGTVQTSDGTAASSAGTDSGSASSSGAADSPAEKYVIEGEELSGDEYLCQVTGVYTNKSGAKLSYVQLSYTLFDADGNQIGTAFANTSNLEDGATWKFEATGSKGVDEVASFKLGEVSAW